MVNHRGEAGCSQAEAGRHDITEALPHNSQSRHASPMRAWLTKLHPQEHENTACVTAAALPFS